MADIKRKSIAKLCLALGLFILAGLSGAGLIFTGGKGRKNPEASGE